MNLKLKRLTGVVCMCVCVQERASVKKRFGIRKKLMKAVLNHSQDDPEGYENSSHRLVLAVAIGSGFWMKWRKD